MKKAMTISLIALCAASGGIWGAEHYARTRVANQVVNLLSNPSTDKQLNQLANKIANSSKGSDSVSNGTGGSAGSSSTSGSANGSKASSGYAPAIPSGSRKEETGLSSTEFTNRQQVVQYAMSHFTQAEIAHYTYLYLHRSSLTSSEKSEIKSQILAHFTPQELQAMMGALHHYK